MDPASPAVTLNNSRRYSYPNSPVHNQVYLCLQFSFDILNIFQKSFKFCIRFFNLLHPKMKHVILEEGKISKT